MAGVFGPDDPTVLDTSAPYAADAPAWRRRRIYSTQVTAYRILALHLSARKFDLVVYPAPGEAMSGACEDVWQDLRQGWYGTRTWSLLRPFHRLGLRAVHVTVRDPNEDTIVQAAAGLRAEFKEGATRLIFALVLSAILVPIAIVKLSGDVRVSTIIGLAPLVGNYLWEVVARVWNGRRGRLRWYVV